MAGTKSIPWNRGAIDIGIDGLLVAAALEPSDLLAPSLDGS